MTEKRRRREPRSQWYETNYPQQCVPADDLEQGEALTGLFTRLAPTLQEVELVCGTSEGYLQGGWNNSDYGIIRGVRHFKFTTRPRNPEVRLKLFDDVWRISYDEGRGNYQFVLAVREEENDE